MQHAAAGSTDITSWEICQKSRNGEEMEIQSWSNLTGQVVQMMGNQRKQTMNYATDSVPGMPCTSLPSKFVVFSPNGEMEKGASASALDITSRDETGWHHSPGWARDSCIHNKPLVIQPNGGNANL